MRTKVGVKVCIANLCGLCLLAAMANSAQASFHLWQISQVYSNASGTIQYIQFQQPAVSFDDESFLSFANLSENTFSNLYAFPTDLPSTPGPNSFFLVATPGYAAFPGVPAPDYILPTNKWFDPAGDTINYASVVDNLTLTPGLLPTNGTQALFRNISTHATITGTNFITNFAGQTGTIPVAVPEPATLSALLAATALMLGRRPRRCPR